MDDIKKKIDEIVKKITSDKKFAKEFKDNPIRAVEKVIGIDLPDDVINNIVDGVKAKLTADNAKSMIDKVTNLFDKK